MNVRGLVLGGLVALTAGCTAVTEEVRATVEFAFQEKADATMTKEKIDSFPYTSLYATWEGSPRALVVLGYIDKPNDRHFITAEKETLVMRGGRIIRTQALNDNLVAVSNLKNDPLNCIINRPDNCDLQWARHYDYRLNSKNVSRKVNSRFTVRETDVLDLPFGQVEATLVEENGTFLLTGESFTNYFWLESDGHVVKSRQQLFPEKAPLSLTQVTWIGREYP